MQSEDTMTKTIEEQIEDARDDLAFIKGERFRVGTASRMAERAARRLATLEAVRDGKMIPVYATASVASDATWAAYGHCFDGPDAGDVLYRIQHDDGDTLRHPACIAAEQAAALVPSCEVIADETTATAEPAAWAVGDRVRFDGDAGVRMGATGIVRRVTACDDLVITWDNPEDCPPHLVDWMWLPYRFTRLSSAPASAQSSHLDGGARSLDASEALREARVHGMREGFDLADDSMGADNYPLLLAAIEAVRKGER